MNTSFKIHRLKQSSEGSALLVVLAILGIMFILFTVNNKTLLRLSREVDLINKKQTNYWSTVSAVGTTPAPNK